MSSEFESFTTSMKVRKLHSMARVPSYENGASSLDLFASVKGWIQPGERLKVATGISVEIEDGYCGYILSRSGLSVRHGVIVLNAPGIIDANNKEEICVVLYNAGNEIFMLGPGARIAQLVVMEIPHINIEEASEEGAYKDDEEPHTLSSFLSDEETAISA